MLTIDTSNHLYFKSSVDSTLLIACSIEVTRVHVVTLAMRCSSDDWRVKIIALLFLFVIILIILIIKITSSLKTENNSTTRLLVVVNMLTTMDVMMIFIATIILTVAKSVNCPNLLC